MGVSNWFGVGGSGAELVDVGRMLVGTAVNVPGAASGTAVFSAVGEIITGNVGGASSPTAASFGAITNAITPAQ